MTTGIATEIAQLPTDATTAVVRRITNDRGEIVTVEIRHDTDGTYFLLASITGPRRPHQHFRSQRQEMHNDLSAVDADGLAARYLELQPPDSNYLVPSSER